ncbi:80 kDa nuclear cap-binding protein [Aphelenchoides fujianensis]|nr:80 kDa nuclear cap-binding protein [Aphelenchoides fujianensis]
MTERRKRVADDGEDMLGKVRRMGEGDAGRDVGPNLVEAISKVDETADSSIDTALEELADKLVDQVDAYESEILKILSDCVAYAPEKITVFSTLCGLLNVKRNQFGDAIVSRLVGDLNKRLKADDYDIVVRIVTFLADLGNANVLTFDSIAEFLFGFLDQATAQNLLSDFYVFCVMHTLPWIGGALHKDQPATLEGLMTNVEKYLNNRQKNHVKILGVWEQVEQHEQEDYMDSLWAQLKNMQEAEWRENHIDRHYAGFEKIFADAVAHNLPSVALPAFDSEVYKYPLPHVVFRLFANSDCPDDVPALPEGNTIERFLVEEELNWIISNNHLNVRLWSVPPCKSLLAYKKQNIVPLNHVIVEVIFSQLFRLPKTPHLELFYGALLIELCRGQSSSMPQVLAQAAELLYQRCRSLHPACLDRFHLSNFQYRWSWSDWVDCVDRPKYDRRQVFVREVLEKCMRLAYLEKLTPILPEELLPLLPEKPEVVYVLDDPAHPAHAQGETFTKLLADAQHSELLLELQADRLATPDDPNFRYDPDMIAVFTAVLIKRSSRTFSHTFASFTKHVDLFRKVAGGDREVQSTILRTVYDCWYKHKQMLGMLVDKLVKMRIIEPISIVRWLFCDEMKEEFHRSWMWELLYVAIFRLDCQFTIMQDELEQMQKKSSRVQKFEASPHFASKAEEETNGELADELTKLSETVAALDKDMREMLLDVCHKFTVCLTEQLVLINESMEENREEAEMKFQFLLGRFKQLFLANPEAMWKFADVLHADLFSTADIDRQIVEVYEQFRSLKCSS